MDNKEKIEEDQCPDVEFISAFFDKELEKNSSEYKHIKKCPSCQQAIKEFSRFDDIILKELSCDIPDDVAQRIALNVSKEIKKKRPNRLAFPSWTFRIAASIAVLGLVAFTLYKNTQTPVRTATKNKPAVAKIRHVSDAVMSPGTSDISPVNTVAKVTDSKSNSNLISPGAVSLYSLSPAGFGEQNSPPMLFSDLKEKDGKAPVKITPVVRHVWIIKDVKKLKQEFAAVCRKLDIPLKDNTLMMNPKGGKLTMTLTKKQLVSLVRLFKLDDFELVSSEAPQPEQKHFSGYASDPVIYNIEFVVNK